MQRKIERRPKPSCARRTVIGGSKRDAMITALAADDLFLFRLADGGMVIPDHLVSRVVNRAGITEKRLVGPSGAIQISFSARSMAGLTVLPVKE